MGRMRKKQRPRRPEVQTRNIEISSCGMTVRISATSPRGGGSRTSRPGRGWSLRETVDEPIRGVRDVVLCARARRLAHAVHTCAALAHSFGGFKMAPQRPQRRFVLHALPR